MLSRLTCLWGILVAMDDDEAQLALLELALPSHTPEGLSVSALLKEGRLVVQEKGQFEYVIFEYADGHEREGLQFVLDRFLELDDRCKAMAKESPLALDLAGWRWNRRRAAQRLKRWFENHRPPLLELPASYHALVDTILRDVETPQEWDLSALQDEWLGTCGVSLFQAYKRRESERPVLVVASMPSALAGLLGEVDEAFCHGLFRATVALCRAIIDDAFHRAADRWPDKVLPTVRNGLGPLISAFDPSLLPDEVKRVAFIVADRGNQAMHDSQVEFDEENALETLTLTWRLVRWLARKGFFDEDGRLEAARST